MVSVLITSIHPAHRSMQTNLFSETSFPRHAKVLNALHKLDLHIRVEMEKTAAYPESICFAHPSGTMYEADMLTWKYLSISVVHAINNKAHGAELSEELFSTIFGPEAARMVSEQDVFSGLMQVRKALWETWKQLITFKHKFEWCLGAMF